MQFFGSLESHAEGWGRGGEEEESGEKAGRGEGIIRLKH